MLVPTLYIHTGKVTPEALQAFFVSAKKRVIFLLEALVKQSKSLMITGC